MDFYSIFKNSPHNKDWLLSDENGFYSKNQILRLESLRPILSQLESLPTNGLLVVDQVQNAHFFQVLLWASSNNQIILALDSRMTLYEKKKIISELKPVGLLNCKTLVLEKFNEPNRTDFSQWGLIFQTSGTSGGSKYVFVSESKLISNSKHSANFQSIGSQSLCFGHLSLSHSGGLTMQVLPTFLNGGQVVIADKFKPNQYVKSINSLKPSHFVMIPSHYRLLKKRGLLERINLAQHPWIISGSEPIPYEFFDDIKKMGGKALGVYGMTEAGPFLCIAEGSDMIQNQGSILGAPLPSLSQNMHLDPSGQIVVSGDIINPYVIIEDSRMTSKSSSKPVLETGDYGYRYNETFYFTHRRNELINYGGIKFSIAEIETAILEFPEVEACRVYKRFDTIRNEVPCADIVFLNGKANLQALQEFLKIRLSSLKVPKMIKVVASIKKTSIDKILRAQ